MLGNFALLGEQGDEVLGNFALLGEKPIRGAGDDLMNGGPGSDQHRIQLINGANVKIHDDGQDQAFDSVEIEGTSTPERFDVWLEADGTQAGDVSRSTHSGKDGGEVRFSNVEFVKLSTGDEQGSEGDVVTAQSADVDDPKDAIGDGVKNPIDVFIDGGAPMVRPGDKLFTDGSVGFANFEKVKKHRGK